MIKSLKLNRESISNIIYVIIFLIPIFRYYDVPGTSIGSESLLIVLLFFFTALLNILIPIGSVTVDKVVQKSRNWYIVFLAWCVIVTLFYEVFTDINSRHSASAYSLNNFYIGLSCGIIIALMYSPNVNTKNAFKIYSFIVQILLVIFFVQWLMVLSGRVMSFKLPFHAFNGSWRFRNGFIFGIDGTPSALFSEKAHFAQYILPYIALCLFNRDTTIKRSMLRAIISSVAVISTVSGNGIIGVAIIWAFYFVFYGKGKVFNRIIISIIGMTIIIGLYLTLQSLPAFEQMFNVLFYNSSRNSMEGTKAAYRIYRGFDIYSKLPFGQKIVGVGYMHMRPFSSTYGIVSKYDNAWKSYEYFSTVTQILLYFGLIGFILYLKHIWSLLRSASSLVKCLIVLFASLFLSSQLLFQNSFIMYAAIIIMVYFDNNNEKSVIE